MKLRAHRPDWSWIVLVCATGLTLDSRASAPPPVQLVVQPCVEADEAEIRRLFALELHAQPIDGAVEDNQATRAKVTCLSPGTVELRVEDPITGKTLSRTLEFQTCALQDRPRLLSLALIELLVATWSELVVSPTPRLPESGMASASERRASAESMIRERMPVALRTFDLRLLPVGAFQGFADTGGGMFGGGLRLAADHGRTFGWTLDVLYLRGEEHHASGQVAFMTLSGAATASIRLPVSITTLRAGLGLRGGIARLSGEPLTDRLKGATVAGAFFGPLTQLGMSLQVSPRIILELVIEGGLVVTPVSGFLPEGSRIAIEGPWLGAQLGLGWSP